MKKLLLASTAIVAFGASAQAADLGSPRMPIAAAVVAPVFNWTGLYLGAQVGGAWANTGYNLDIPATPNSGTGFKTSAFFGGVHIGYRWQVNQFVFGVVSDLELTSARGNDGGFGGTIDQINRRWQGSTRLVAGFAVDRALIYATGGLAYGDFRYSRPNFDAQTITNTKIGYTVGAGVAYAISPNWSVSLEYRYSGYGSQGYAFAAGSQRTLTPYNEHSVRLGVSYMFTTGPSAVVARY
ncbi:porin family protein [Phreatobacter aquaticus]|uniref:Porin family protein n=1 Tax=Phreatobacter aquaticus TaxID=2570229 RepID=A0A4D7QS79_9HYPH|nr:outer membrane protein [Phreatobacter aquaticus]QCK88309.1 porin family protein [Phreatobacter aquaticus]